ncbi:hypothetical protein [Azospirillum argentinense]
MFDYTAAELERIDESLEPKLAWAKDRQALCEQMALDASRLLSCVEDRLDDYRGQGFFRRCWSSLSGKTGAVERANQRDLIEMQRHAWRYINLLQERELLLAHSVITVKNNLLALAVSQNDTKIEITRLANRIYDRFVVLEQRVDKIEVSQAIHSWLLTLATYDYEDRYPANLRLLRVVSDFYALKSGPWSVVELKYLHKALGEVGLNPKHVVTVSDFIDGLIDEIEFQGFGLFSPLITPSHPGALGNGFVIDTISSPAFSALYQIKDNYTVSSRVIRALQKRLELGHAEAIKIIMNEFIDELGIDTSATVPVKDLAVEILGCLSLAERLASVEDRCGETEVSGAGNAHSGQDAFPTAAPTPNRAHREERDMPASNGNTEPGGSRWQNDFIQCLRTYEGDDLYVLENIPAKKLKNAIRSFPIDHRDDVVALIDTTLFGSCEDGMAFTMRGIYWRNDWATDSQEHFLSWDELVGVKKGIVKKSSTVELGRGNACSFAGASTGADKARNLLIQLVTMYEEHCRSGSASSGGANA